MTGVDLTRIDGMDSYAALKVVSEIGTDMAERGPLRPLLSPENRITNGIVIRSKTKSQRQPDGQGPALGRLPAPEDSTTGSAQGNPLDGTEALTDAVRAALGYIAARREWPHGTQTDLYDVTTALATGTLPEDDDKASELLDSAPEEGIDLCSAFAASMGQPASVKFGMFYDSRDGCDADATMFARRSIELARRLGREKAVAS